ncbi:MAG: radical SAM protein [Candidatus Margulisbacteria bacterium]|nr:radical SAM protein [Candidatus Margulisiibacteriota bacterium]
MKVCLINPTSTRKNWGHSFPPLGVAYLAAVALDLGHEAFIIDRDLLLDENGGNLSKVDRLMEELIRREKPAIVVLSVTTPLIPDAYKCAVLAKTIDPRIKTVIGGVHATVLPEQTMAECPAIDLLVVGEGEAVFADIISGRESGEILGLAYRADEEIVINPSRPVIVDLDTIKMPARHLLRMDEYTKKSKYLIRGVSLRGTSIFTSRGCPYACSFCAGPLVFGRGVRFHSVDRVIAEIEQIVERYKVEGIYFADDMFSAKRDRALEICERLISSGLSKKIVFAVQLKVNAVDEVLLKKLKQAGCIQVEYGFESGSQRILELMNKRSTVEQNVRAAELTRSLGLRFLANIITGMPGETKEDFMATIDFIKRIKPDVTGFYKLILLPGSQLYERQQTSSGHIVSPQRWEQALQDDLSVNLTAMKDEEYFALFKHYGRFISLNNARNYFVYNLKREPLGTLLETSGLVFNKLVRTLTKKGHPDEE